MKSLKELLEVKLDKDEILEEIYYFIMKNFTIRKGGLDISSEPNENGKHIVSTKGDVEGKRNITELTNEYFVWGTVGGTFNVNGCDKLVSLEGGPIEAGEFWVGSCTELTTLKGAPKSVKGDFNASYCIKLKSLDIPETNVMGNFDISNCGNLTNLKGSPKRVFGQYICLDCSGLIKANVGRKEVEDNCRVVSKEIVC